MITLVSTYIFIASGGGGRGGLSAAAQSIITSPSLHSYGRVFVGLSGLGYLVWSCRDPVRQPNLGGVVFPRHQPKFGKLFGFAHHPSLWDENGEQFDLGVRAVPDQPKQCGHVEVKGMQFAWYFRYSGAGWKIRCEQAGAGRMIRRAVKRPSMIRRIPPQRRCCSGVWWCRST